MSFIAPMLASPMREGFAPKPGETIAEEKFDGIRLIAEVNHEQAEDLLSECYVQTWSRNGIPHAVPRHLRDALAQLPTGIYDGELFVPGKRSYGATRLDHADQLRFVIFDILNLLNVDVTPRPLAARREFLTEIFNRESSQSEWLSLSEARVVNSFDDVINFRDEVWKRDGEGLILKQLSAPYRPAKRDKSWIKIKQLKSAVLTIIGFAESKGEIINRGQYATVILKDEAGCTTTVKTRNDAEIARFEKEAGITTIGGQHLAIGRKLRIEYQERTPDGSYRHPRWDRFEDE